MFDIIGDVHGHADELKKLLTKLGYEHNGICYSHKGEYRRVIFVGDLIDRGPKIREVLEIVKAMVDKGQALCIMGNHEYNAIAFWEKIYDKDERIGGHYREHNHKNIIQHFKTIEAFQNREAEWFEYLQWFQTLPICLDLPELRVVHATWDDNYVKLEKDLAYQIARPFNSHSAPRPMEGYLTRKVVSESFRSVLRCPTDGKEYYMDKPPYDVYKLLEKVLKGEEVEMPEGVTFEDKDGNVRRKARSKWWIDPNNKTYAEYLEVYASEADPKLKEMPVEDEEILERTGYPEDAPPVFFGHYWLKGEPQLQAHNVCCLDYSVAKGGKLVAYRFDGEQKLDASKFVYV